LSDDVDRGEVEGRKIAAQSCVAPEFGGCLKYRVEAPSGGAVQEETKKDALID
jgi:hypothetical protein